MEDEKDRSISEAYLQAAIEGDINLLLSLEPSLNLIDLQTLELALTIARTSGKDGALVIAESAMKKKIEMQNEEYLQAVMEGDIKKLTICLGSLDAVTMETLKIAERIINISEKDEVKPIIEFAIKTKIEKQTKKAEIKKISLNHHSQKRKGESKNESPKTSLQLPLQLEKSLPAQKEALACKICFEGFNLRDRRPRSFSCGHSFCTPCCVQLLGQPEVKCPQCRVVHDKNVSHVQEIPIAFQIEEILEAFGGKLCDDPVEATAETSSTPERNPSSASNVGKGCSNSVSSEEDKIDQIKKDNKVVIPKDASIHQKLCKMDVNGPTITFRFGAGDVIGKGVLQLPFRWLTLNSYLRCSWVRVNFCDKEMKEMLIEDFKRHREMSLYRCKKLLDHCDRNYDYDNSTDAWGCIKHDFYIRV